MTLGEKLSRIQQEMKAPKNLWNKFGKYPYRNAEGIIEAFKPFEKEYKVYMVISDAIVTIGDSIYVQSKATLYDCESDSSISADAYAREPKSKKGMDESQLTGSSSSYARKYALNGLFLLDDSKDSDSNEYNDECLHEYPDEYDTHSLIEDFKSEIKRTGKSFNYFLNQAGVKTIEELEPDYLKYAISNLRMYPDRDRNRKK